MKSFYKTWGELGTDDKIQYMKNAVNLDPGKAVNQVIKGINDYTRNVRNVACQTLLALAEKVANEEKTRFPGTIGSDEEHTGSEIFAIPVFIEIQKTLSSEGIKIYLETLLTAGDTGPEAAWQYFVMEKVSPKIVIDIISRLKQPLILTFVFQYCFAPHYDRRRYYSLIKQLLRGIKDYHAAADFLADIYDAIYVSGAQTLALEGDLFDELFERLDINANVVDKDFKSADRDQNIRGIKIAGLTDNHELLMHVCLMADSDRDVDTRVLSIKVVSRIYEKFPDKVSRVFYFLLEDSQAEVVIAALTALFYVGDPKAPNKAADALKKHPNIRIHLFKELSTLSSTAFYAYMDTLSSDQRQDFKRIIVKELIRGNPEKLTFIFSHLTNSSNPAVKDEAIRLLMKIKKNKDETIRMAVKEGCPETLSMNSNEGGLIGRFSKYVKTSPLLKMKNSLTDEKLIHHDKVFDGIVLNDTSIQNVDFTDSVFVNCKLMGCHFEDVEMTGVRFENVNFDNASFVSCRFNNTIVNHTSAELSEFKSCDFSGAVINQSDFSGADFRGAFFTSAVMTRADFSRASFFCSFFSGCKAVKSVFAETDFCRTDYTRIHMLDCFIEQSRVCDSEIHAYRKLHASHAKPLAIDIPEILLQTDVLDTWWFDLLIHFTESERLRQRFINYNYNHKEFANDTFSKDASDLFELIPFLLHNPKKLVGEKYIGPDDDLITSDFMIACGCSGVFGYVPNNYVKTLATRYFDVDLKQLFTPPESTIEALFTIGSTGSVAQTRDSDVDYWVCVHKSVMEPVSLEYLEIKLGAIEKWARIQFGIEVHFFIVDIEDAKQDRFGESNLESSGSAQGKILKEEFYRTMILVAGKIPFWCVAPETLDDREYELIFQAMSAFHKDYIDLGNISGIPFGEYFGASMWQLFKSLKSPYKSVMKMALLEKYIAKNKGAKLLCNKLKQRWGEGSNLLYTDPYILLFSEVIVNYTDKPVSRRIIEMCFFLKLGIRSMKELDESILKIRKKIITKSAGLFLWDLEMLYDSGYFSEWPYERIAELDNNIKDFMITTYRQVSGFLNEKNRDDTLITAEDLTILGRRMFVQFSERPDKVPSLPVVAERVPLFDRLYLFYRKVITSKGTTGTWEVYPVNKKLEREAGNAGAILKNKRHVEEIAAWMVHNQLNTKETLFHLLPNSTFVTSQDMIDLLTEINQFFGTTRIDEGDTSAFLERETIKKIMITANFSCSRKHNTIIEFTAIYLTSWGEFCTKAFQSSKGLSNMSLALEVAVRSINMEFLSEDAVGMVPKMSKKRIRSGDTIQMV